MICLVCFNHSWHKTQRYIYGCRTTAWVPFTQLSVSGEPTCHVKVGFEPSGLPASAGAAAGDGAGNDSISRPFIPPSSIRPDHRNLAQLARGRRHAIPIRICSCSCSCKKHLSSPPHESIRKITREGRKKHSSV